MRKPKPALCRYRRGAAYAKLPSTRRRRPLRVETLETRCLLAGDLGLLDIVPEGEGPDPLMAIRLEAVDPQSFQPLDAVYQGEEFILLASVNDLRPDALGVYAAYLDILFPSEFFSVSGDLGQAALIYGGGFGNGIAGEVLTGLVDELGTFAADTNPPGRGEQPLAGIRLVATQIGDVRITSDAADKSPEHDILLFDRDDPVSTDLVTYGDLSLRILAPRPGKPVDAFADFKIVDENSAENFFGVLENDKNTTGSPLVITRVDTSNSHGTVTITNDGKHLIYTPNRGFVGTDQFAYTVSADGEEDTANVRVQVQGVASQADRVAYALEITDRTGNPVAAVTVGDDFVLHVTAKDLRDVPLGVFAAYLDVQYTSGIAEVAGPIVYAPSYPNDQVGDTSVPGEIDEVGAFADSNPLGAGAFEVFQVPFRAVSPGRVVFEGDPADIDPASQTLLYDDDDAIPIDDIAFGRVALTVVPAVVAVDDTFAVNLGSAAQTFAVLENDVNLGGGALKVVAVDTTRLLGTVAVAANGLGVTYRPPSGFGGSEQFSYTISGPAGSSTAEVTVHLQPTSGFDDQLGIRLATADLNGNHISSIEAGQEFLVQAFVQDLRAAGIDRGIYAAYFDLLYQRNDIHPVQSETSSRGPLVEFGADYLNGTHLDASVPGILNEVGAFQTGTTPLGTGESVLFSARFRAASARGVSDSFQITEDGAVSLSVLENDLPNSGVTRIQADPADRTPSSDALFYDPVEAVPYHRIRYGSASLVIAPGGNPTIASVRAGSRGGLITIAPDGKSLSYSPAPNFNGVETFTYSLDGQSQIPVSVTVLPVNDAPVAVSDSYHLREARAVEVAASAGVMANDFDHDGDALAVQLMEGTSHGTLQLATDGSFTYIPNENFPGHDSFTYRVTDGQLVSEIATARIDVVSRPVSIRLEAVDVNGNAIFEVAANEPLVTRALVQDLRSPSETELGIGAVYLDIAYDADAIAPAVLTDGPLGLDIRFGAAYGNAITGAVLPEGRLNDIGALQTGLQPLGNSELELFRLAFDTSGPRAVDDSYVVAGGTSVNRLNVLRNEAELRWNITLDAQYAAHSPNADVLYLDPAVPVPEADIFFGDLTLAVRNGSLTIQSVGDTSSGAVVSIAPGGAVHYEPVADFTGVDSFSYTVVDSRGLTATATVTVAVTVTWQNLVQPTDVNGDGNDSPLDALIIINDLNTNGARELTDQVINAFLDVNGDGKVSPIDVLLVVNRLILKASSGEGEFAATQSSSANEIQDAALTPPLGALDAIRSNIFLTSHTTLESSGPVGGPAIASVEGLVFAVPFWEVAREQARDDDAEDHHLTDLLEAIADDIAPLWAAFT